MIDTLNNFLAREEEAVNKWLSQKSGLLNIPFYSSADIRDAGFKAACVDLNVFPAGFNNLCEKFISQAIDSIHHILKKQFNNKPYSRVLIVPEAHSRNKFYNAHLYSLEKILQSAGLEVTIAAMNSDIFLETFDGNIVEVKKIKREGNIIENENGEPFDWILLNNDLSDGPIDWLEGIEQPILPPMAYGWYKRRKSDFFNSYSALINEMAGEFNFDPWLLCAITDIEKDVDFSSENGRVKIADKVDHTLKLIKSKYNDYGIDNTPHVFIKNDSGTYGIGIIVVKSPDEIINMNRKSRNKMAVGKGKQPIKNIIIQEAVPTRSVTEDFVTEPVMYMFGTEIIGTFLRANNERGTIDNLNAKGMSFYRYCTLHPLEHPKECVCYSESQMLYQTLGKLSAIAAAGEITHTNSRRNWNITNK